MKTYLSIFIVTSLFVALSVFANPIRNGFDLANSHIPSYDIQNGGPAKDGIPALDNPNFVMGYQAGFLQPEDRVLGVMFAGQPRAYPIKILNWHEVVNDRDVVTNQAIVVTYCPLCGTGMVFNANINSRRHTFGVSGLLYNSSGLLYDRETQSLWSPMMKRAVTGSSAGQTLNAIPIAHVSWKAWQRQHPTTWVLSTNTGFARDYNTSPYLNYDKNNQLLFPVLHQNPRYHPKDRVLGVCLDGQLNNQCKGYPFAELSQNGRQSIFDNFAGRNLRINIDPVNQDGQVIDAQTNQVIDSVNTYWFAWYAFHPNTEIYTLQ